MSNSTDWTIGIDLGDKKSCVFALNCSSGEVVTSEFEMTETALREHSADSPRGRVVFESGGQSRWVKRVLNSMGFEVVVADPRRLKLITKSSRKDDRNDAMRLAELGSVNLKSTRLELLNPIEHRDDMLQADLAVLHSRDTLVSVRTRLINANRGTVKSSGGRLKSCSTPSFHRLRDEIPSELAPLVDQLALLTKQIRALDRTIEKIQQDRYPEVEAMLKIRGVGVLTALALRLVLADASRFQRSRDAAAYVGLCPKQHESGSISKQLGTTKTGDRFLRRLLVQAAHDILGPFGEDSDLRRWGERLQSRGGKASKIRAVVAVASKLAVVLHRLWTDQSEYEPLRQNSKQVA